MLRRLRSALPAVVVGSLLTAVVAFAGASPAASADVDETFSFTGGTQEFVVPTGVTSVDVVACGGSGAASVAPGGLGGEAATTIAVTAGEVLTVVVGGAGAGSVGGFNGGGAGGGVGGGGLGGGGGGASDVRQGGAALADRAVIGGGGGGGGFLFVDGGGGEGGGLTGGDGGAGDDFPVPSGLEPAGGGTQTSGGAGGIGPLGTGSDGGLGIGGAGSGGGGGGGGGGLHGGGGGGAVLISPESFGAGGGGGSGLGSSHAPGSCSGDGWVTIAYSDGGLPTITPGAGAVVEGGAGSQTVVTVPVALSNPAVTPVTVDWATLDTGADGVASAGVDYLADSGTVTFAPGETTANFEITVLGDEIDEPPLLYGELGLVAFSNLSPNATLNTDEFFGLGLFIIIDDDPPPTITPRAGAAVEGAAGSQTVVEVPVTLSNPSATPVTVDWATVDTGGSGVASAGVDYEADAGTLTFAPGATSRTVEITVLGDDIDEPPLLYGEWGLVAFSNPSPSAILDTSTFFGLGLFIIIDDD